MGEVAQKQADEDLVRKSKKQARNHKAGKLAGRYKVHNAGSAAFTGQQAKNN